MANKKMFKSKNPALQFITQDDHNVQEKYNTRELQEEQDTQQVYQTQGKKGQKLPRINMAFRPDILEYLTLISSIEGISKTAYVNKLLAADRETKGELIDKVKELREAHNNKPMN